MNSSDKVPKVNVEDPQGNAKGVFLMINYKMYGAVTDPFMTGLSQVVEKEGQRQCLPNDPLPPTPHPPPPPPPTQKKRKGRELTLKHNTFVNQHLTIHFYTPLFPQNIVDALFR